MVEVSEDQLVTVENALQVILQGLDPSTPDDVKQQIMEADQLLGGLIDKAKQGQAAPSGFGQSGDTGGPK